MAEPMTMDAGKIVKMEVDYSATCDEKIPVCKKMAGEGKVQEALDQLMALEKQTRTGADTVSTGRVLVAIVQICFEAGDWDTLNENIVLLSKRRSQLKQAVTRMVQESCGYLDRAPDREACLRLITTLRTVTEGKIYVEVERARLTHRLAKMKETEGDTEGAATIMQELQVETYGSMERREKVELLLEQMRLCLARSDFIRTQIISKKINTKFFEDGQSKEEVQALKLKYYDLMVKLGQHEGSYLAICKHHRAVLTTPSVQNDPDRRNLVLKNALLYLVLSSYDNEQSDLIHRIAAEKQMEDIPKYRDLLQLFINPELIRWTELCGLYQEELMKGSPGSPPTEVFNQASEQGRTRWKDLKNRVVEHNIRIMAKYYTRISLNRMADLLNLTVQESEEFLSALVVNKTVQAKTDRLAQVVHFAPAKDPNEILNEWATNLNDLMQLLNRTTHLINKEEMVHKHLNLIAPPSTTSLAAKE